MTWDLSKIMIRFGDHIPKQRIESLLEWIKLREILRQYSINFIFDVGANRGQFAKSLRRIGYKGYICSIEPIPEEFDRLEKAMRQDNKWSGYQIALGSKDTQQVFHVALQSTAMSSFLKHKDQNAKMSDIEVTVRQLDSIFEEATSAVQDPRVFLKMDTQGYDLKVIEGAQRSIRQIIGLQSEISVEPIYDEMPHYLEALKSYEELGFKLAGLYEIAGNFTEKTINEMNCLMIRTEYEKSYKST